MNSVSTHPYENLQSTTGPLKFHPLSWQPISPEYHTGQSFYAVDADADAHGVEQRALRPAVLVAAY